MKPRFLKPLHFCSAKIIPLVFDNSLSYYEQLCAFSAKLNNIIDYVNSMSLGLTEFYEMVNTELENYVTMQEFNEFKEYILALISQISGGGVGETIETGTVYTVGGVDYTAGDNAEIFNSYDGGTRNKAAGSYSSASGAGTAALATASHAEGTQTITTANAAHAEGAATSATAQAAHSEGQQTTASGMSSHAEGIQSTASANAAHAEGGETTASGVAAHAEGDSTLASGAAAHTEGQDTIASGSNSHAENLGTTASGEYSHAENYHTIASGNCSHAEGSVNTAAGENSHAEGYNVTVSSLNAHGEGSTNTITAYCADSHIEGGENEIRGSSSGESLRSHAEGSDNTIIQSSSAHIEGDHNTVANSQRSHCEGFSNSIANSNQGHAEGSNNLVTGDNAHAQNTYNEASGNSSTAIGNHTVSAGTDSFSSGSHTVAYGTCSVAMGSSTSAAGNNQLAIGNYNTPDSTSVSKTDDEYSYSLTKYPFIIGNGYYNSLSGTEKRSDAFKVDCDGKIYVGADTNGINLKQFYDSFTVDSSSNNYVLTATFINGVGSYSWQPASGGGSGSYLERVLYNTWNAFDVGTEITLSEDATNYDALIIISSYHETGSGDDYYYHFGSCIIPGTIVQTSINESALSGTYRGIFDIASTIANLNYYIIYNAKFTANNKLVSTAKYTGGFPTAQSGIHKIIGVKY